MLRDPGRPPSAPPAPGVSGGSGTAAAGRAPTTSDRRMGDLLTAPADPVGNGGRDNEHSDLIMRVGDALVNERGVRYVTGLG